jgi:integrase
MPASGDLVHLPHGHRTQRERDDRNQRQANVKAVQRMLGHAKASMTLDTYADLFDEDLDRVADRLDAAIQATADTLRTASQL